MVLARILSSWRSEPDIGGNISAWETEPARPAQLSDFPAELHPALAQALAHQGIYRLYSHQIEAWKHARSGRNVVIVTGTSSGKTLAYNLPVLQTLLAEPEARALYLFPTKALAQDQHSGLRYLAQQIKGAGAPVSPAIYDGDTPSGARSSIRGSSRVVLTNPDMLHTGILPHHTLWAEFFRSLRFIVIDELHTYRGVFGSHVANVLRRVQRVARFYGSHPQFILTSATIANPKELAERLVEGPVELVDNDGAAKGERHFMIYNPPIINPDIGLRRSALLESVRLAGELIDRGVQTILFGRTRRSVELLLTYLRQSLASPPDSVRGYRSGYLPAERRAIEQGLRQGNVRGVVATSALELGIDIGGMGAAVLAGYPGTIAAARQQAGRAGRKTEASLAILVATADALDQFLAHHPEYFFGRSPEQALIQPNHLLIALDHIRCAAFELPFRLGESFGSLPAETVAEYLNFLAEGGELHENRGSFFWLADAYPASGISLRSASPVQVLLQIDRDGELVTIGQVDLESAAWMVHPQAIYLHEGQPYLIEDLNLENNLARLSPTQVDYYTEPLRDTAVERISTLKEEPAQACRKFYGELQVTTRVTGFRQVRYYTYERLGVGELSLPPTQLQTTGYWLTLDPATVARLQEMGVWTGSPNDYGPNWSLLTRRVRQRDGFRCQVCGMLEQGTAHHVHHKVPFRSFASIEAANQLDNLITLCPSCHRRVEQNVRMRSGLAGMAYVLGNLAPFFLMCDSRDLGVHSDPQSPLGEGQPTVVIYDNLPVGIGLSERLFDLHAELLARAQETVSACECTDGCPSCVGPAGENGAGGKRETVEILDLLKLI